MGAIAKGVVYMLAVFGALSLAFVAWTLWRTSLNDGGSATPAIAAPSVRDERRACRYFEREHSAFSSSYRDRWVSVRGELRAQHAKAVRQLADDVQGGALAPLLDRWAELVAGPADLEENDTADETLTNVRFECDVLDDR